MAPGVPHAPSPSGRWGGGGGRLNRRALAMWGATGPLAPQGLVLMEGSHLLWPDGPQATAGWHCPERPGAQGPGSPIPSPSSAWNLPCCPQRFGLEGACPRALPIAEACSSSHRRLGMGRQGTGGHEIPSLKFKTQPSCSSPRLWAQGGTVGEKGFPRLSCRAWLGLPRHPLSLWPSPDTPSACGPVL